MTDARRASGYRGLAVIADCAPAAAIGVYRMWRDAGYAAAAIVAGVVADVALHHRDSRRATLTACSGLLAWIIMPSHNMRPARP